MIEARDLRKVYRTAEVETSALSNVNLAVREGEFVAVMGPSGCGKTTLLNILGLIDSPTEGQVLLRGRDASRLPEGERARLRRGVIGFVFQSFNLIDDLTVEENIELPLLYARVPPAERRRRLAEVMDRLELAPRRRHFPLQLSGGQQQRVAVARAVAAHPALLLADEPTGNLDSNQGTQVMQLLAGLHAEGATVVMVTHSPAYADYAQRVIHLFDGHIVTENLRGEFRV
jgi:putative ABC transport system ATP-binding protein